MFKKRETTFIFIILMLVFSRLVNAAYVVARKPHRLAQMDNSTIVIPVGGTYDPSPAELKAFPDRFREVPDSQTVYKMTPTDEKTIKEVKTMVEGGEVSPQEALDWELSISRRLPTSEPRTTLVSWLQEKVLA